VPLPSTPQPWPPPALDHVFARMGEWSAWYAGDPDGLSKVYSGRNAANVFPTDRTSQRRGGLVGRLARWFWGQPTATNQQRTKLHIPVAADIATASADLLFAEEVQLINEDLADSDRERLDEILDGNDWHAKLIEAAELASALGGGYLRTTWDAEVAGHPLITVMGGDQAIPEFKYGQLQAVTFWQVVARTDTKVWRHLERHEKGRIEHGLYEGTDDKLGRRIPLTELAITADLVLTDEGGIVTGWDGLTVAYIPNIRPNRTWRNDPAGRDLGRSDYAGVEQLMDSLDETYTSWMRDVRLGKARIMIPGNMLQNIGTDPGAGASFDMDQEVFTPLADLAGSAANQTLQLSAQQFAIRTMEHEATAKALLVAILRGAGYSAQTFGLAEEATATATEVHAREKRSTTTREKKSRYFAKAIAGCLEAVTALDRIVFNTGPGPIVDILPEFPAAAQPSLLEQAQSVQALFAAQSASAETRVRMLHPEWDDKQIDDEVTAIMDEFGASVTDPDDIQPGLAEDAAGPTDLSGQPPLPENEQPGLSK
jgi:A118 family predicted phage portal protein